MFRLLCVICLVLWGNNVSAEMRVYKYGEIPNVEELQEILLQGKVEANVEAKKSRLGASKGLTIGSGATTEQKKVPVRNQGTREISLPIVFENNSYELQNDQNTTQILENISIALQNKDVKLIIEGHTDAVGSKDYNISLSKQRAATVKNYLLQRGLKNNNLITRGMGYENPLPGTDPMDGVNRRVQFKVMN
ncbi:MAG: OmpA family protein [Desulfamplus sp.]|nr:OmpA family protein [Desulfamplus sp.]